MNYLEDLNSKKDICGIRKTLCKMGDKSYYKPSVLMNLVRTEQTAFSLLNIFYMQDVSNEGIFDFGGKINTLSDYLGFINDRDFLKPLQFLLINGFIELYKDENYCKTDLSTYKFKVYYPIKDCKEPTFVNLEDLNINVDKNIDYKITNIERLEEIDLSLEEVNNRIEKMINLYQILNNYSFDDLLLRGVTNIGLEKLGEVEYRFNTELAVIIDKDIWIVFDNFISKANVDIRNIFPSIFAEIELEDITLNIEFEQEVWDGVSELKFKLDFL